MNDQALVVRDLRKRYGDIQAVDGISFTVEYGEVFGFLGPNGAGKTTTVECVEGLREPDSGEITLLGVEKGGMDKALQQRIGVQLQTTGLYPKLTVREILKLFADLYEHSLSPDYLLELVGLESMEKTASAKLSGGQLQRLSLALALINEPEMAFLDEPTTGLDPQSRRGLWDIIKDLQRRGRTVLLTTHYMEEAEELCDRVAIMDRGKIIEMDSPERLIRKYFQDTAIELDVAEGLERSDLERLTAVSNATAEDGHFTLYSVDVPRTMAALFALAEARSVTLGALTIRQATLEDVFLKITGRRIR